MSYCVNCGVELDQSLESCPLCQTPVINPNNKPQKAAVPAFPSARGKVDPVKKTDTAILISVVLGSTSAACGLLNLLIFTQNLWSLYVIGGCCLLWIFSAPLYTPRKLTSYLFLLFDGAGVILYCWIISWRHPGNGWFTELALPIAALVTLLLCIFAFFLRHFKTSILSGAVVLFIEIPLLCIGIEIIIRNSLENRLYISWSSIVLTCCAIIVIALITIIKRTRLREEVRRRMHI